MRILLVGRHRQWKSIEPLKCINADFQTITLPSRPAFIAILVREIVDISMKLKTYKPEIVLCHGVSYVSLTALLLAKVTSRPFAVRVAGDIFEDYRTKMIHYRKQRQLIRLIKCWRRYKIALFIMRHSSGIITVANHLKEKFLSQEGRNLPHIEVAPVPCDISRFTHASVDSMSNTEFSGNKIILAVTNFNYEEKLEGLKKALPALANVLEQRQDVVFLIAGGGFFLNEIRSYIEKRHPDLFNERRVILLGFVQEIEKLYAIADIVVYYSLMDGCPNVMLEAWAARKPLVVNDSDWSREHVKKGTALITRDESELIEKIELLLDSTEVREELSSKGYEYVSQNYTNEVVGKKLVEALSRLTKKPPAKASVKGTW